MILQKLDGLVESINKNFTDALRKHTIELPPVFQMFEYVISNTTHGNVEYHIELKDMFHNMKIVTSSYVVEPYLAKNNPQYAVEFSQEMFYTELTKYMMFIVSSKYVTTKGHEVRIMSMADILEDIVKQHKTGGFKNVNTDWLYGKQLNENKKRLNG
jgi:hypothetical protein